MSEHRCPENICRMFDVSGGSARREARLAAINWLKAQTIAIGDVVFMPHAETGELISFTKSEASA